MRAEPRAQLAPWQQPDLELSTAIPALTGGKCAGRSRNVPDVDVSYTLASVLPKAELIPAYDIEANAQGLTCLSPARERTPHSASPH